MEEWRPVPIEGYEHLYEVSNQGHVRSLRKNCFSCGSELPDRIMANRIKRDGYYAIGLRGKRHGPGRKQDEFRVHRLVAGAFIPNPQDKPMVNHKDSNRLNNAVENLEWATARENNLHAFTHGRRRAASRSEGGPDGGPAL